MSGSVANRGLRQTAYNSSKSAVLQMCRSMAAELGQYGIRVNSVCVLFIGCLAEFALSFLDVAFL